MDEVDSILIDEARTPLIISGPAEESTDKYYRINAIIPKLKPGARITGDKKAEERAELEKTGDYIVDEKAKTVTLTEMGMAHVEKLLGRARTSGTRPTWTCCTTSTRACARTPSSSATSTTW